MTPHPSPLLRPMHRPMHRHFALAVSAALLAINNPHRAKTFPEIPTFGEAGYAAISLPGWAGMFLPAGTPPDIVAKMSQEVQRIFTDPEVAAATGPVIYYDMPLRRFGAIADDAVRRAVMKVTSEFNLLFGSNMALRASAWHEIRDDACLDPEDYFHEDVDLSIHLNEHGLKVAYSSDMVTGMSARRLDDSPLQFYNYVMRFERTYDKHKVESLALRAPMAIFLSAYPALKAMRLGRNRWAAYTEQLPPLGQ